MLNPVFSIAHMREIGRSWSLPLCASIHLRVTSANILRCGSSGSISNSFPSQMLKSPLNQLRDVIASKVTFKDGPQEVLTFHYLFFLCHYSSLCRSIFCRGFHELLWNLLAKAVSVTLSTPLQKTLCLIPMLFLSKKSGKSLCYMLI